LGVVCSADASSTGGEMTWHVPEGPVMGGKWMIDQKDVPYTAFRKNAGRGGKISTEVLVQRN